MILTELTEEDNIEIKKLTQEILSKACEMNCRRFDNSVKANFIDRFVGVSERAIKKRHRNERFFFFTENEASFGLYQFFANIYNAKHIAKNIYIRVEDDVFTEQFDAIIPLGKIMLPNGSIVTTSVIELDIKVTDPDIRSINHGMPFDIIGYRLVCPQF